MLKVPSSISNEHFRSLKMQEMTFVAYRSDVYPEKNDVLFEEFAVVYVLEGEKKFISAEKELIVKKGDIIFFQRGFYTMMESIDSSYKSLVFFFNERMVREFAAKHMAIIPNKILQSTEEKLIKIRSNTKFSAYIESLFPHFGTENQLTPFFLKVKFHELLLHLIELDQDFANILFKIYGGNKPDLRFIVENYFLKKLSIAELARLSGRSLSSFKREFEAEFKDTPANYIKLLKLNHSDLLIKHTDKTVQEISSEVGYESVSHFIQAYKAYFGHSPKQKI